MTGPACGNNPNHRMSDGDRRVVETFKAYLAAQAAIAKTLYGFTPLPEISWEEASESDRARYRRRAAAVLAVLPAPVDHDTGASDWSALAERTGRLRKTTKELVDRAEELETKVAQMAADQAAILREAADRLPDADLPFVSPMGRQQTADWLRRVADETAATETQPERCAHCGQPIRRVTGTLAAWWVHDPGGNTVCDWARAAASPRATPKPATETEPLCCPLCADKPLLRTPAEAHDHFRAVHSEQQLAGPGPWPLLVPPPSCPGYETVPNRCPCPCEGCKHHCGAHQPAAGARQDGSDRPGLRERHRAAWAALTPEQQAARLAELDQDDERQDGAQPS